MKARPDYCPDDLDETKDCPACGEPPSGICRARFNRSKPKPLIEIILVDKRAVWSDEQIASFHRQDCLTAKLKTFDVRY